jgi:hypothetical protein
MADRFSPLTRSAGENPAESPAIERSAGDRASPANMPEGILASERSSRVPTFKVTWGTEIPALVETTGEYPDAFTASQTTLDALPKGPDGWHLLDPRNRADLVNMTQIDGDAHIDCTPEPMISVDRMPMKEYARRQLRACLEMTKQSYAGDPDLPKFVAKIEAQIASI